MLSELFILSQDYLAKKNKAFRRYFIENTDLSHRMNILIGARGVGKTTTVVQHLLDHAHGNALDPKILYLPVDHFLVSRYTLYEIAENFVQHGGEYIAFDEIHQYENWSIELKSIYDTFNQLKVFASGSSALEIHKGSHDLSRRALVYELYGLSLREYLQLKYAIKLEPIAFAQLIDHDEQLSMSVQYLNYFAENNIKILPELKQYFINGFYPFSEDLPVTSHFLMALEQNIHVTLDSDLTAIYPYLNGHSIKKIKELLIYIAGEKPFTANWSKIKNIVGVADIRTLKNYFKYLEDANLIRILPQATQKLKKVEHGEKIYLNNPNLLHTLAPESPNISTLRETFFVTMLAKDHQVQHSQKGDFTIDNQYIFEVGGKKKSFSQIQSLSNAYLSLDDIERGIGNKLPLWLFGFLY